MSQDVIENPLRTLFTTDLIDDLRGFPKRIMDTELGTIKRLNMGRKVATPAVAVVGDILAIVRGDLWHLDNLLCDGMDLIQALASDAYATPIIALGLSIMGGENLACGDPVTPDDGHKFGEGSVIFERVEGALKSASPTEEWTGSGATGYALADAKQANRAADMARVDAKMQQLIGEQAIQLTDTRATIDNCAEWLHAFIIPAIAARAIPVDGLIISELIEVSGVLATMPIASFKFGEMIARASETAHGINQAAAEYAAIAGERVLTGIGSAGPGVTPAPVPAAPAAPSAPGGPAPAGSSGAPTGSGAPTTGAPSVPAAPSPPGAPAGPAPTTGAPGWPSGPAGPAFSGPSAPAFSGGGGSGSAGAGGGFGAPAGGAGSTGGFGDAPVGGGGVPGGTATAMPASDAAAGPGGAQQGAGGAGLLSSLLGTAGQSLGQVGQGAQTAAGSALPAAMSAIPATAGVPAGGTPPQPAGAAAAGADKQPGSEAEKKAAVVANPEKDPEKDPDNEPGKDPAKDPEADNARPDEQSAAKPVDRPAVLVGGALPGSDGPRAPIHVEVELDPEQLTQPVHLVLDPKNATSPVTTA